MKKTAYGFLFLLLVGPIISCNSDDDSNKPNLNESADVPTVYEGWTLRWNDEFNEAQINSNNWNYELGDGTDYGLPIGWGNNEKQIYTQSSENSSIVDDEGASVLAITAREDNSGGFTSAKLTTQNLFSMRFGRIELKAKMPKGQGLLPAIWMLGDNKDQIDWPGCGEIDIVEVVGNDPSKLYSTVHYTNDENNYGESQRDYVLSSGDFSDSYHIFTLDWTPESLTFSLDGQEISTILIEDDMKEFLRSSYLILNVAVGGNWPGEPDATTMFPQTMYADYIRVYSKNDFLAPDAPALDIAEETIGQVLEPNIGDNAIQAGFTDLGSLEVVVYGPGAPEIASSETAIDGDASLVFDFPGGNWGGAYLELETPKDISAFTNIKFSLNKPDALVNSEIKLEAGATNAFVYLADYTGTEITDGFVEYTIPLADFPGVDLSGLTIPFSIWNPQDASDAFVEATVLIDNIYFSM
jgi:beta-glucanase (GH16 family)